VAHSSVARHNGEVEPVRDGDAVQGIVEHKDATPAQRAVREVYLSSVQESDWGDNLLGAQPLTAGQRRDLGTDSGCEADLRVVFDNGNAEEARGINICERAEITLRPGWVVE
jgi:hypothetical protein